MTLARRVRDAVAGEAALIRTDTLRALGWILAIISFTALVETTGVAFRRMVYPFTLEWMEAGMLDHVRVVLAGKPLYTEPSFAWTPFIYTPLYYWVTAAFSKVFGVSFFTARLVSTVSMVGCFAMIFHIVKREVGGLVAPLAAAALFAATFKVTGFWIDLARVDALFFLLVLAAIYAARHGGGYASAVLSGLFFCAAFLTKQSALLLAVPALGGLLVLSWRRGLVAAAVFGVAMAAAIGWMNHVSHGWFSYYVFVVPGKHEVDTRTWHDFVVKAVWKPMPFAVVLTLFAFVMGIFGEKQRGAALFWAVILVGAWMHGASGLMHIGGYDNALIPSCGVLAILSGFSLQWIFSHREDTELAKRLKAFTAVATMLQLSALSFDPRECLPRPEDKVAGRQMIELLRNQPGTMYSFGFGFYLMRTDRPEIYANAMAMADVFRAGDKARNQLLFEDIRAAIASRKFEAIIVDNAMGLLPYEVRQTVEQNYKHYRVLYNGDSGWPKTAYGARPDSIWVLK